MAIAWASPAWSANYDMKTLAGARGHFSIVYETVTTDDFLIAPAYSFQRMAFTQGSTLEIEVFACDTKAYAAATCESLGAVTATTNNLELKTGRQWLVIDVTTAETVGSVSYITIQSNPQNAGAGGGSGGGVEEYAFADFPTDGDPSIIIGTDCATAACDAGGGSTRVALYWDGDSYENVDTTGGVTGLTNPLAADIDGDGSYGLTNANIVEADVVIGAAIASQYATVADAFTAACSLPSRTVVIDEDFSITSTITTGCDYLTIKGTGDNATLTGSAGITILDIENDWVTVRGVGFTHASANSGNIAIRCADDLPSASGCSDLLLTENTFTGVSQNGIAIDGRAIVSSVIADNFIFNWNKGIYCENNTASYDCNQVDIRGNRIRSNQAYGIQWVDMTSVLNVSGNTIEGDQDVGIFCDDGAGIVSLVGNHFENNNGGGTSVDILRQDVAGSSNGACSYIMVGNRFGLSAAANYREATQGPTRTIGFGNYWRKGWDVTAGTTRPEWYPQFNPARIDPGGTYDSVSRGTNWLAPDCGNEDALPMLPGDLCQDSDDGSLWYCDDPTLVGNDTSTDAAFCDDNTELSRVSVVQIQADCSTAIGAGTFCVDSDNDTLYYGDGATSTAIAGGGGGAPTDADYLVGTANGSLSAEIVVGTSPGGELGGTWASPTIDDSLAVTSWTLTTPLFSGKMDADAGSVNDDDCTGEQGFFWYDDTDSAFEFCNANSGTPVVLGGGSFDATTIDAVTWSDGANASNAWTFDVSGTDPVVTWGNGTVDFSTPITATSFTADPSDTAEVRLTSATGADEAVLDFDDNGTTTSLTVRVDDGNGDDQAYVEFDGATVRALWSVPMTLASEATPTTDADGEISVDVDGWGTGFDAIEFFNGTASAYVVATTASDTPTNGQVPKWNTGGSITWENDSTGSGLGTSLSSSTNDILSGAASSGVLVIGGTGTTNNEKLSLDFESVANAVTITSSTGVTTINHPDNSIPTADLATEVRSMYWGAAALSADGTNCANPAEVTINSGPKLYTIICADNDSSTIYGSTVMPDSWDGGTVTFETTTIQTAANTSALNGDIAAQCRGDGETPSSTWGTEVAIDDAAVTGSNNNDQITSGAVTPAGTCAAGDTLYWRYQVDATGTTTAVSTLHFLGFKMEYTSNVGD